MSPERLAYLQRTRRRERAVRLCRWGVLAALLLLWEGAARLGLIDSFIFSQPSRIVSTACAMAKDGLLVHVRVTVEETLCGFLLGAAAGVLIAVLLWWSPFVSRVSEPYLVVLNSLPKIALGPVIIILAGAGTRAIVFMAMAISLIVTVLEMLSGFRDTDEGAVRMARTFGATKRQIFLKIVLPLSIPVVATFTLYYAVGYWNSWYNCMLFTNDSRLLLLQLYVYRFVQQAGLEYSGTAAAYRIQTGEMTMNIEGIKAASCVAAVVPILLVYPFLQKYFAKGIMLGAIKG